MLLFIHRNTRISIFLCIPKTNYNIELRLVETYVWDVYFSIDLVFILFLKLIFITISFAALLKVCQH